MAFEAIEALRLGLATVTHLLVFDRDAAILGNTLANPQSATATGIGLEILPDDLAQGRDVFVEGWASALIRQTHGQPLFQAGELLDQ